MENVDVGATQASPIRAKAETRVKVASSFARSRAQVRPKTEIGLLADISAKLDRVTAILAAQGKDRETQVAILAAANCDSAFIGTLVGMSAGAVRKLPAWKRSQQGQSEDGDEQEGSPS